MKKFMKVFTGKSCKKHLQVAKKAAAMALTAALAFSGSVPGYALENELSLRGNADTVKTEENVKADTAATASYVKTVMGDTVEATDYKKVILLMQSGVECREIVGKYLEKMKGYVSVSDEKLLFDGAEQPVMYAALITVLNLDGQSAVNFNGINLIKALDKCLYSYKTAEDMDAAIGNPYYYQILVPAVSAYAGYMEHGEAIRELLLEALLLNYDSEKEEGKPEAGIYYWGYSADNNGTVIPALAYYAEKPGIQEKIDAAVEFNKSLVEDDGGTRYDNGDYSTASNGDSTGLSLYLYAELGMAEDAAAAYQGLMQFKSGSTDGAYIYQQGGKDSSLATLDALAGLVAYQRHLEGKSGIFHMNAVPEKLSDKRITVTVETAAYTYDGKAKTPSVTVKDGNRILAKGADYTVSYRNNKNVGTATVIVTGKGIYTGTVEKTFRIKAVAVARVSGLKQAAATASSIRLTWKKAAKVSGYEVWRCTKKNGTYKKVGTVAGNSLTDKKLKAGTVYYYKIRAYKKVGKKPFYSSYTSKIKAVTKPRATKVTLKAGKKQIRITWKKVTGATKYRIYIATSKKGKYKVIKNAGASAASYKKKGLRSGKRYYIKIQSYTVNGAGKKIYSGWSSVRSIKVK